MPALTLPLPCKLHASEGRWHTKDRLRSADTEVHVTASEGIQPKVSRVLELSNFSRRPQKICGSRVLEGVALAQLCDDRSFPLKSSLVRTNFGESFLRSSGSSGRTGGLQDVLLRVLTCNGAFSVDTRHSTILIQHLPLMSFAWIWPGPAALMDRVFTSSPLHATMQRVQLDLERRECSNRRDCSKRHGSWAYWRCSPFGYSCCFLALPGCVHPTNKVSIVRGTCEMVRRFRSFKLFGTWPRIVSTCCIQGI